MFRLPKVFYVDIHRLLILDSWVITGENQRL